MAGSHHATLTQNESALIDGEDVRLTLPEATMFIVASSGALWVLLFGLTNWIFG